MSLCWILLLPLAVVAEKLDELWLRQPLISNQSLLAEARVQFQSVVVSADVITQSTLPQLRMVAAELSDGLRNLLGRETPHKCCGMIHKVSLGTLLVSVDAKRYSHLGSEGFAIHVRDQTVQLQAGAASGALYGAFRLLAYMQRGASVPQEVESIPAMELRVWDLWDDLGGDVTRGFAGDSIVWPNALWKDPEADDGPSPFRLFVAPCNTSDPYQQWSGLALEKPFENVSSVHNRASNQCISSAGSIIAKCGSAEAGTFWYNTTSRQLSIGPLVPGVVGRSRRCIDIDHALGPNIDTYHCHPLYPGGGGERDYRNQQFDISGTEWKQLASVSAAGQCLTLRNSFPPSPAAPSNVSWSDRFAKMLRLLKSAGVNGIVLNDVNACYQENQVLLQSQLLRNISANIGPALRRYGITPYFSICFGSPLLISNVTCDPKSKRAQDWWSNKTAEMYRLFEGQFGGFLVKADSEGNAGPQAYNATEAEGANLIARALKPYGGILMWRAFVYGGNSKIGHEELVKQAYDTFKPLDGQFDDNVVVQIKNGPMDFQIREPLHPLLGGLKHTNVMMETQAAQEYTGQQIHAVNLVTMWKEYLDFDTHQDGPNSTISKLLTTGFDGNSHNTGVGRRLSGMACVSNLGTFANWTGHVLAASNTYGFARLSWDPSQSAESINREWTQMTFPGKSNGDVVDTVGQILTKSREVFEGYTSPLGIGFIVFGGGGYKAGHGACAPATPGPGGGPRGEVCPTSPGATAHGLGDLRGGLDHYWVDPCSNYGVANYSNFGLGCDRTSKGTGYASQYAPAVRDMFNNIQTCPRKNLLWFHNLGWNHKIIDSDGKSVTLLELINRTHFDSVDEAKQMAKDWLSLEGMIDAERFHGVKARFAQQVNDAAAMCKTIMGQYTHWAKQTPADMEYLI